MFNKKRAAFQSGRTALNIKSIHKGMKKYITTEELRDIVSELAGNFMENERYDITITLSHFTSRDDLTVSVQDKESAYETISNESYTIIGVPCDSIDISRNIKEAIKQHEAKMAKANNETESPIEL